MTDGDESGAAPGAGGTGGEGSPPSPEPGGDGPDGPLGPVRAGLGRFLAAETGPLVFLREILTSALAVGLVGLLLFGASGVWPPMVAVQSGSMEPHMHKGDLVFVTEPGRYAAGAAYGDTGVVTYRAGREADYRTFGAFGSVIVFESPARGGPPIIHRARFWVSEGENWYDRADPDHVRAEDCGELPYCPAPRAGFITKGDDNDLYDPAYGEGAITGPVSPDRIRGVARVRVPYLGWVRLAFSGAAAWLPAAPGGAGVGAGVGSATAGNATVSPG